MGVAYDINVFHVLLLTWFLNTRVIMEKPKLTSVLVSRRNFVADFGVSEVRYFRPSYFSLVLPL